MPASGGDTNVVLVLDTSGSMGDSVGTNTTRLDVLKASANELLEQYHNLGNVKVEVIQFNSNPSQVGTAWMTVDQAEGLYCEPYVWRLNQLHKYVLIRAD